VCSLNGWNGFVIILLRAVGRMKLSAFCNKVMVAERLWSVRNPGNPAKTRRESSHRLIHNQLQCA
jgi:hypothetical protein